MNEIEQEDWLDRQLRDAAPYINDAGFTARVLKQLPRKLSGPRREALRAMIIFGITLLASVLAYVLSDGGRFVAIALERLSMLPMLWVFAIALVAGIVVTAAALAAALNQSHEVRAL